MIQQLFVHCYVPSNLDNSKIWSRSIVSLLVDNEDSNLVAKGCHGFCLQDRAGDIILAAFAFEQIHTTKQLPHNLIEPVVRTYLQCSTVKYL